MLLLVATAHASASRQPTPGTVTFLGRWALPRSRINQVVLGRRSIEAERRCGSLGSSAPDRYWRNLQVRYDLETAEDELGGALAEIEPLKGAG